MKYLYAIIISLIILSSCISTKYVNINVYDPALITFDSTIVNVIIVDNVPDSKNQLDSIVNNNWGTEFITLSADSAKWALTKSLAQFMDEEQYFNRVARYRYVTGRDSTFDKNLPLTKTDIADICEKTESDALISLDQIIISPTIEKISDYPSTINLLEIKTGVLLRTYKADGTMLMPNITMIDSLYWEGIELRNRIIKPLPDFEEATMEAAVNLADKLVDVYIPHWRETQRWYYSIGKNASKAAEQAQWSEAAVLWNEIFDKEHNNDSRKARLAFNIALANECMDDIENAIKWIDIAFYLIPQHNNTILADHTTVYRNELMKRKIDKEKLANQIGN